MFKPKFQILLKKEHFRPDEVICLGSQLTKIIEALKVTLVPHTWYVADVDAYGKTVKKYNIASNFLKKIGTDVSLIKICSEIDQFLSGVFLAIKDEFSSRDLDKIEISTEDEQAREINIKGVLLEIRAFDTSFFEICSDDELLIKNLSDKFNAHYKSMV